MAMPSGIGKLDRKRITTILRNTQHTISVAEAAKILMLPKQYTAKLLARWALKGWVSRIQRGLYIPVPLESATSDILLEDPWLIAEKLYHPCYIGAWSAAEHWGLTEQIFRAVVVFTIKKIKNHNPVIKGTSFLLHTISDQFLFGLRALWRGQVKVFISDPSRTLLDFLINPKFAGGSRSAIDIFKNYLHSENKNLGLLINYATQLNNGAVFKRLGFLLEQYAPEESEAIAACKKNLTIGNTKLDPALFSNKLITRWHIWVPRDWEK